MPEVNRKVERNRKTDAEEFYQGKRFLNNKDLATSGRFWPPEAGLGRRVPLWLTNSGLAMPGYNPRFDSNDLTLRAFNYISSSDGKNYSLSTA
jgi:hypothetical protein